MNKISSRGWLAASSAAMAFVLAQPTFAQQAGNEAPATETSPRSQDGGLTDIIVTAQKRSENLQNVPVAVTAVTAQEITNARIENLADLRSIAPNLYVVTQGGGSAIPATTMRGQLSGAATNPTVDNGISYYIDGVYLGALTGIIFDVADIERIEIIRGPAGTLFGTNSTGGAINYITSGPSGQFHVTQDFSYARFGSFRSKTRIDLPEWNGLSTSISYLYNDKQSNVRNFRRSTIDYSDNTGGRVGALASVRDLNETKTDAIHFAARWNLSDDLTANYKFDWTRQESSPPAIYLLGFPDTAAGVSSYRIVASQMFFGGSTLDDYLTTQRERVAYNDTTTPTVTKTQSHYLSVDYAANDVLSIKNTTSWRSLRRNAFTSSLDGAGLLQVPVAFDAGGVPTAFAPLSLLTVRCCEQLSQFSNELQFNVDTDKVDATGGLFYYTRRSLRGKNPFGGQTTDIFQAYPGYEHPGAPPSDFQRSYFYRVKQAAAYGQATYHLTDAFDLTGGIRYTQDDKTFFDTMTGNTGQTYQYSKGNFSYLANLAYKPTANALLYLKFVTSFIAGGTSAGARARDSVTGNTFQGPAIPYSEEKAKSWEAGVKADLLDRKLRTNLALFHVEYSDLQTPVFSPNGCITSPSGICEPVISASYTTNFGKSRAYGAEFEITAVPIDNLTLSASGSYTDFDYLQISPLVLANAPVTRVEDYPESLRPKFLANLSANYVMPLAGDTTLSLRIDGNYRSAITVTTSKFSDARFIAAGLPYDNSYLNDLARQKALFTLNARATLADLPVGPTRATLSLWGRNLTNKQQLNFLGNTGITATGIFDEPVTYGIDLRVKL